MATGDVDKNNQQTSRLRAQYGLFGLRVINRLALFYIRTCSVNTVAGYYY